MMVGTANGTKSDPALTSNRITALTRPTRATCIEVIARLAAPVEPAGDVVSQRQASLHDAVTLALELRGRFLQFLEIAEHVSDVRVFEFGRDDEPWVDDGVTAANSLASSSWRCRTPAPPRAPGRFGRSVPHRSASSARAN